MNLLAWVGLTALLLLAVALDLQSRRIPNALTVAAGLFALALNAALPAGTGLFAAGNNGGHGVLMALGAVAAALAVGVLLWRVGLFGAGDAKLLAASAAFVGWGGVTLLLLTTLLAGGLLALAWMAMRRVPAISGLVSGDQRLPYSVAVAIGAITTALTLQLGVTYFTFV